MLLAASRRHRDHTHPPSDAVPPSPRACPFRSALHSIRHCDGYTQNEAPIHLLAAYLLSASETHRGIAPVSTELPRSRDPRRWLIRAFCPTWTGGPDSLTQYIQCTLPPLHRRQRRPFAVLAGLAGLKWRGWLAVRQFFPKWASSGAQPKLGRVGFGENCPHEIARVSCWNFSSGRARPCGCWAHPVCLLGRCLETKAEKPVYGRSEAARQTVLPVTAAPALSDGRRRVVTLPR